MSGFGVLLAKELMDQWRTFKFLIIGGVFLFFGLSTPLLIKFLPELIELAGTGGMSIEIPPPNAIQAMAEYSATMAQFGVLMAVLVAMGAVAREVESGTAMMVLSKPVSRTAYILAKFSAGSLNFAAALAVGGLACWVYTLILFGEAPVVGFVGQTLLLGLFLMLSLAVTILFSSLLRNQLAAGGLALAVVIAQAALSTLPWVGKYLPGQLVTWGNNVLAGAPGGGAWGAMALTLGVIGLALYFASYILNRREL